MTEGRVDPSRVRSIAIFTLWKPTRYVRFLFSIRSGDQAEVAVVSQFRAIRDRNSQRSQR
jgi:hypothetical protein